MSKIIDARGLSCPEPVLLTKRSIASENHITVLVDTEVSRENVTRFLKDQGFSVQSSEKEDSFEILAKR